MKLNDAHPWNSAANEWNHVYDGTQANYTGVEGTIANLGTANNPDGGQVVTIPGWTKYNEGSVFHTDSDITAMPLSVAYNNCDVEPPFRFVWEMMQQKNALKLNKKTETTTAPDNLWANYIGKSIADIENAESENNLKYSPSVEQDAPEGGKITIPYFPYRPNLTTIFQYDKWKDEPADSDKWDWIQNPLTSQSSGLDCGALVGSAANYTGQPYHSAMLFSSGTNEWNGSRGYTMDPTNLVKPAYSWEIFSHMRLDIENDYKKAENIMVDQPLYPGDIILFKDTHNAAGVLKPSPTYNHVAMVFMVKYNDEGKTDFKNVVLIEAASGLDKELRVLNTQTMFDYIENFFEGNRLYTDILIFKRLRVR